MIASIGSWTLTKEKGAGALLSLEVTAGGFSVSQRPHRKTTSSAKGNLIPGRLAF